MVKNSQNNNKEIYVSKFYSDDLTETKYQELLKQGHENLDIKNEISKYVAEHLYECMKMGSARTFRDKLHAEYKDRISSNFSDIILRDIYISYDNRFKAIKKLIDYRPTETVVSYYKKTVKEHNKGDFKEIKTVTKKSIMLSCILKYISNNLNNLNIDILKNINENYNLVDDEIRMFYDCFLDYVEKYTFERLYNLAKLKYERIINLYNKPIEFKSLTIKGRSRKKDIIVRNPNKNSVIKAYMILSWRDYTLNNLMESKIDDFREEIENNPDVVFDDININDMKEKNTLIIPVKLNSFYGN